MIVIVMVLSLAVMIFLLLLVFFNIRYYDYFFSSVHKSSKHIDHHQFPIKSYPVLGCTLSLIKNRHRIVEWTAELLEKSSSSTITLTGLFGQSCILTSNPSNVQHILKTRFHVYQKDVILRRSLIDLLGDGIFLVDGAKWKFQRQLMSHEFKANTFHHIVKTVTMKELSARLLTLFSSATEADHVLDLQDIFRRFTFDTVCQVAFGYDPHYLLPSLALPNTPLAEAYRTAINISMGRCICPPLLWKAKRLLNIGSEKNLSLAVNELREFIRKRIIEKKEKQILSNNPYSVDDFLDRMLARADHNNMSNVFDEKFYIDEAVNLILGAEDTLCSALTWFFWLVSSNPQVENEIIREIISDQKGKEMVYMHASICESMRLYPPVPQESKQAMEDDIWPNGTKVKKGTRVLYNIFAMGRSAELWGKNWAEFNPERWLEKDGSTNRGDWRFIPRDPFTYPVFQAGPRTCIGKDIAFMQIKLVAANVLRQYRFVPAVEGYTPVYGSCMTSKIRNGFPVRILRRP